MISISAWIFSRTFNAMVFIFCSLKTDRTLKKILLTGSAVERINKQREPTDVSSRTFLCLK